MRVKCACVLRNYGDLGCFLSWTSLISHDLSEGCSPVAIVGVDPGMRVLRRIPSCSTYSDSLQHKTVRMAEELTDEFVAKELAKEARDSTIKYSAMGLDAFLPKKPANHPKPNTRFLRNIIKETDIHNAALLAKETQESKARLQELSITQRGGDIRRRQLGDIAAILGGQTVKRRKPNEKDIEAERGSKSSHGSRLEEPRGRFRHEDSLKKRQRSDDHEASDAQKGRSSRSHRDDENENASRHRKRSKHAHEHVESDDGHSRSYEIRRSRRDAETVERSKGSRSQRRRSRSRSAEHGDSKERHHHRRPRSYSHTLSGSDDEADRIHHNRHRTHNADSRKRKYHQSSRSPSVHDYELDRSKRHHPGRDQKRSSDSPSQSSKSLDEALRRQGSKVKVEPKSKPAESDSDPLDDIIGPRPRLKFPVISRGRGKISAASGIDSRFSANYDPTADVQLDFDEENDWEQALEALRDRQKWKQQGAERLKAAGFTDDEIKKWERGGEKRDEDVKWSKSGEGREWDRGKFITDDGNVATGAEWGRLK